MFEKLFAKRPTSKMDIAMALVALIAAGYKAVETVRDYKSEQEIEK